MSSLQDTVDLGNDAAAHALAQRLAQVAPAGVQVVGSYEPGSGRFLGAYMTGPRGDVIRTLEAAQAGLVAAIRAQAALEGGLAAGRSGRSRQAG